MIDQMGLMTLLNALKDYQGYPTHRTANEVLRDQKLERSLVERCYFNIGWHAGRANSAPELKGEAATEKLLPLLLDFTEMIAKMVKSPENFPEAWGLAKKGRKKGSYAAWHFEPGYQVVAAVIALEPEKAIASHIRWGVKEEWLDKKIDNSKHERRLGLIKKRQEAEEAAYLQAMGKNIVRLKPRKTRH